MGKGQRAVVFAAILLFMAEGASWAGLILSLNFTGSGFAGTTPYTISGTLVGTFSGPEQISVTSGSGVLQMGTDPAIG